jgi:hypothetical protein
MKQITFVAFLLFQAVALSAQGRRTLQLARLYQKGQLTVVGRKAEAVKERGQRYLKLADAASEGLVWLPVNNFSQGILELRLRGKDVLQKSFVGIAFHAVNDSTYDAVYCRPFNFLAQDSVRRIHAIQYVSRPVHTWKKLREQRNAEFEKAISNPPDPNGWFTLTLRITDNKVEAYIDDTATPALVVYKLNDRVKGKLGIFMGDGSGGDFTSFRIVSIEEK